MATRYRGLVLYDGGCGLCNRSVRFLLRIDHDRLLRFAPLQGETAQAVFDRYTDLDPSLNSVIYLRDFDETKETAYLHSDAVWRMLVDVGGRWRLVGRMLRLIPAPLRNWGYRVIARHRHRIPGGDACELPTADITSDPRFLP